MTIWALHFTLDSEVTQKCGYVRATAQHNEVADGWYYVSVMTFPPGAALAEDN